MEGVEVKDVDRRSGYAYLTVSKESPLTLASLKKAIEKTDFDFVDLQWVVTKPRETPRGAKKKSTPPEETDQ